MTGDPTNFHPNVAWKEAEVTALRRLAEREYMKDYVGNCEGQSPDPEKGGRMRFWDSIFVKLGGTTHYGPDEKGWHDAPGEASASAECIDLETAPGVADQIGAEIVEIMTTYDQQQAAGIYGGTPGELEHMGDVWRLLRGWSERLIAAKSQDEASERQ